MTKEATINAALKLALEALSVCTSNNWADKELQGKAWDACKEALTSTQCEKQPAKGLNTISTEELIYAAGVYDGKVLEREACAKVCEEGEFMTFGCVAAGIRARGNT